MSVVYVLYFFLDYFRSFTISFVQAATNNCETINLFSDLLYNIDDINQVYDYRKKKGQVHFC